MKFLPTRVPGAYLIEIEPRSDERGFFARTFCRREFAAHGLPTDYVQQSVSYNVRARTLRGLHYQAAPHLEPKIVRCTQGAVFDVIVDVRPDSEARGRWVGVELSAENRRALYVPGGVAHGFLTLAPDCEVFYQMAEYYHAESARGVRWNDPAFGIDWPATPEVISERDASYPDFV
ncbi:MAG: dTDP-4-dehydrorhamnose 3,5-epimerase [Planctomycetota bacterium]|nr:MAG: dTDP-4-dehydrorhamnose 3,5-epimerase [Planctomycetota bacterium]